MGGVVTSRDSSSTHQVGLISLRLLDAVQGHSVLTWNFERAAVVNIGRLEENDVVLVDPIVSRLHATIKHVEGSWELTALGKHGVLVNDRRVESIELRHEMVFRLGPNGPLLQFINLDQAAPPVSQINRTTVSFDPIMLDMLGIDEEQAAQEVREITENEDFERLLGRARELREKRSPRED